MSQYRTVRLRAYGGEVIERCLISESAWVLVISTEQEIAAAEREGREPTVVGFPRSALVTEPCDVPQG